MTSLTRIHSSDTKATLLIEIVSGKRRGTTLQLDSVGSPQSEPVVLREDEAVEFTLVLREERSTLSIFLHDIEVPCTHRYEKDNHWVYQWLPRDTHNRKEAFFHNYFGLAEMAIAARNPSIQDELDLFIPLHPIEVLAKKVNAERVAAMLEFLARQDAKDLASAIRVTRIRSGYKEGGRTETFLIDRLEHNLSFLRRALPALGARPLSKLIQETRLVVPNPDTLIDERSLSWVLENPDSLYETTSIDDAVLYSEGGYYASHKILEGQAKNTYDLYENQVVHGFVATLMASAKLIKAKLLQGFTQTSIVPPEFEGYVSFFSQIKKLSHSINKNKIDRCGRIIDELARIRTWLNNQIPVRKIFLGVPQFTQKAKFNMIYQQVFSRMISWHQYGAPDWGFQDELNSIKDIPKLFEYYVLCVIKAHLDETADGLVGGNNSDAADVFEYNFGSVRVRLLYEPELWSVGHNLSLGQKLVNTEGWTVRSSSWLGGYNEKKISERKARGGYSNRCPDFMIELSSNVGRSLYFIVDAKYTDSKRAFLSYLPDLTMKYLHGVHEQDSGATLCVGLMIVNPSETSGTQHFHHREYSIYGRHPVTPSLMVSSVDVSNAHDPNSNIRADISKVMELMTQRLLSQESKEL